MTIDKIPLVIFAMCSVCILNFLTYKLLLEKDLLARIFYKKYKINLVLVLFTGILLLVIL